MSVSPINADSSAKLRIAFQALLLAAAVFFFAYGIYSKETTWDTLGYAASALTLVEQDIQSIHNEVYKELRAHVTAKEYAELTDGSSYRQTMAEDAEAFGQQLPYYKIRIVFVTLMLILSSLGIGMYWAGHLIAAAAAALGFVLFFYAYKHVIRYEFWLLLPILYYLCGVLATSQKATPDSLAFMWLGVISLAFMRKHASVFPLLALSTLIRTDMVVFVALVLAYFFIFRPEFRIRALLTGVATAVLYIGLNQAVGNHGWLTVFYFVFVSDMLATHPDEFSQLGLNFQQYFSAVFGNLRAVFHDSYFWMFVFNIVLQLILYSHLQPSNTPFKEHLARLPREPVLALTLIALAYVALHYLLYPAIWSRFFVGHYMVAYLGLLCMLSSLIKARDISAIK